jgi:hypothetical protein
MAKKNKSTAKQPGSGMNILVKLLFIAIPVLALVVANKVSPESFCLDDDCVEKIQKEREVSVEPQISKEEEDSISSSSNTVIPDLVPQSSTSDKEEGAEEEPQQLIDFNGQMMTMQEVLDYYTNNPDAADELRQHMIQNAPDDGDDDEPPSPAIQQPDPSLDDGLDTVTNDVTNLTASIGVVQRVEGSDEEFAATRKALLASTKYLKETVLSQRAYSKSYQYCNNQDDLCTFWASIGECDEGAENLEYMLINCLLACQKCDIAPGVDFYIEEDGEHIVVGEKRQSIGELQILSGSQELQEKIMAVIVESHRYMKEEVLVLPEYEEVWEDCYNSEDNCAFWAASGECESNTEYMEVECPLACKRCGPEFGLEDDGNDNKSDDDGANVREEL